jgi:hypothetical protein
MNLEQAYQSCHAIAKANDEDRYLVAMLAPESAGRHLATLLAFNVEVSKIHRVVSEPMLGEIRLQWWREVLDQIYSNQPVHSHEVTLALQDTISALSLPREHFDALLDAHGRDFYERPVDDLSALNDYFKKSEGALLALALKILGQKDISKETSDTLGITWGFARFGLALGLKDPFVQKFLTPNVIGDMQAQDFLSVQVVKRLEQSRMLLPKISTGAAPALLQLALCQPYGRGRQPSAFRRRSTMLWANLTGRY